MLFSYMTPTHRRVHPRDHACPRGLHHRREGQERIQPALAQYCLLPNQHRQYLYVDPRRECSRCCAGWHPAGISRGDGISKPHHQRRRGAGRPLNAPDQVNLDLLAQYVIPTPHYTASGQVSTETPPISVAEKIRRTADVQLNCLMYQYRAGLTLTQFADVPRSAGIAAGR